MCVYQAAYLWCKKVDLVGIHATVPWENRFPVWRAPWEAHVSTGEGPCSIWELFAIWGTQNYLLWSLSVWCTWGWLLASVWALLPLNLCALGPLQHYGVEELWRVWPLQWHAMCQPHRQYRHTHSTYIYVLGQYLVSHKKCDFCWVSILGNWENLETFRLTENLWVVRYL